jgi:hypothetical protein
MAARRLFLRTQRMSYEVCAIREVRRSTSHVYIDCRICRHGGTATEDATKTLSSLTGDFKNGRLSRDGLSHVVELLRAHAQDAHTASGIAEKLLKFLRDAPGQPLLRPFRAAPRSCRGKTRSVLFVGAQRRRRLLRGSGAEATLAPSPLCPMCPRTPPVKCAAASAGHSASGLLSERHFLLQTMMQRGRRGHTGAGRA